MAGVKPAILKPHESKLTMWQHFLFFIPIFCDTVRNTICYAGPQPAGTDTGAYVVYRKARPPSMVGVGQPITTSPYLIADRQSHMPVRTPYSRLWRYYTFKIRNRRIHAHWLAWYQHFVWSCYAVFVNESTTQNNRSVTFPSIQGTASWHAYLFGYCRNVADGILHFNMALLKCS